MKNAKNLPFLGAVFALVVVPLIAHVSGYWMSVAVNVAVLGLLSLGVWLTFVSSFVVLRDLFGYVRSLLKDGSRTVPFRFIADDRWVVVEARGDMETKAGERYDNYYCLIYRIEGGKIHEIREYQDSTLCERVLGPFPQERKHATN